MEWNNQLARHGLFDARVPRYTSYPTSPHFAGDVDAGTFANWISVIPIGSKISLYVHVPFCRRLCWFCACRTQGTTSDAPVRAYIETLKAEIELLGETLPEGVTLERLHWGGGTPTLLSPQMITELAETIFSMAPLAVDGEFSVEIDPNEIDDARLDALAAAGMNRVSIGVQDFDPEIQKTIGREQSYETTAQAIQAIRARGISSLNADILYGLPNQTPEKITQSVQKLLSLSPDRVALYGYAHVPWMARRQKMIPEDQLPSPRKRLELFNVAQKLFEWDGYSSIGIDHFALPDDGLSIAQRTGRLRRNFQGYTEDTSEVLIGLGASSISRFQQGYAQNQPSTSKYTANIRAGQFSTSRGHTFNNEDKLRGRLIERLMCDFKIDAEKVALEFGVTGISIRKFLHDIDAQFDGMVSLKDGILDVPPASRPLTRVIARAFDAYELSKTGHSSAV